MLASFYLGIWTGWMIITRTKSAGFHLPCVVRYTAYSQADEFGVVQALA